MIWVAYGNTCSWAGRKAVCKKSCSEDMYVYGYIKRIV